MNIEELARQAGGIKERDEVFGPVIVFEGKTLEAFASLVLEQAAQKCEKSFSKHHAAEAIRAMKPTQEG
jgi:hypothetical protein